MAAWVRVGRRLAAVDPERFKRMLAIGMGMVGAYDGHGGDVSASGEIHAALLATALGQSCDA